MKLEQASSGRMDRGPALAIRMTRKTPFSTGAVPLTLACVVGTRPEAIKLAPVVLEARRHPTRFRAVVVSTGQHRDLVGPALATFGITPDYELSAMQTGQSIARLTGSCLQQLDEWFGQAPPGVVVVQGDTASALAGALAGFYRQTPVAHVEAGLRTQDTTAPFPEECNRRLIARLASVHFAPTHRARANLAAEGIAPGSIVLTGNTVLDAIELLRPRIAEMSPPFEAARRWARRAQCVERPKLVVVTAHRRENFGAPLDAIAAAVRMLAVLHTDLHFVVLRHPNPQASQAIDRLADEKRISILPPQDYLNTLWLLAHAWLVLTDSGGLQEEAPSFGTPVLVLRRETERLEGIDAGVARLVGTDRDRIVHEVASLLRDPARHMAMRSAANPYGDGRAARRIVASLATTGTAATHRPAA
jgi:UDP-N-acetylglucosamine 2-epimerase